MQSLDRFIITATLMVGTVGNAGALEVREMAGQFTFLDRSVPNCGSLFIGSLGTFLSEDGQTISVVVPCIEMNLAKNSETGEETPLEVHKTYRLLLSLARPKNLNSPPASGGLLYLVEARIPSEERPNTSFKVTRLPVTQFAVANWAPVPRTPQLDR